MIFDLFDKSPSITTTELAQKGPSTLTLLDVREPYEYQGGHIATAQNVPLGKIETYRVKKQPIYVICQSGMRSKQAVAKLRKQGVEAINIKGGMNQWTGPVRSGK